MLVSNLTPPTSVILFGQPSLEPQELKENVKITANPAAKKTLEIDTDLNIIGKITRLTLKIEEKFNHILL